MSQSVVEQSQTTVTSWQQLEFNVQLSDLEQINIMACKGGYYFDKTTNNWVTNTTKTKFRLTGFGYKLKEEGIVLSHLKGNFFTKANRVGARDTWVVIIDQETLDQIPKELLAHGTEHFTKEVLPELQKIINRGVMVRANA